MASELELRWLKTTDFKGAAKRFAVFCKEDIHTQADSEHFSLDVYQDAVKLVLSRLDHSLTLIELTKKIATEAESTQDPGLEGGGEIEAQDKRDNLDDSKEIAGEELHVD